MGMIYAIWQIILCNMIYLILINNIKSYKFNHRRLLQLRKCFESFHFQIYVFIYVENLLSYIALLFLVLNYKMILSFWHAIIYIIGTLSITCHYYNVFIKFYDILEKRKLKVVDLEWINVMWHWIMLLPSFYHTL